MKKSIMVIFIVLFFASILPISEGTSANHTFEITSLTINFDKTNATFIVNYDLGKIPKTYILLFGSKSIEPKIKDIFSNFDYDIVKMNQDETILHVKNISRLENGFYLHDSRKLGASINTIIIYTPDSQDQKKYSNTYLFNWDNVPGIEDYRLLNFLKDDLDINWTENAKILKTDDTTIRVFTAENSIEITLDKNNENALLKISDGRTNNLQVKGGSGENIGKLYIYSTSLYWTPNIYYRS
ncbi:MAG: hypothetical protein O8C63_07025 [Candidatus Methanoperedens sp.]|nr:hypothetical protein [Candidatus Methanoperedens sp.]